MKTLPIGKGIWDIIKDGYIKLDWGTIIANDIPTKREAQNKNTFPSFISKQVDGRR